MRKSYTNILLIKHSNLMALHYITLYSLIRVFISHHCRSFLLKSMETNTEAHNWTMYMGWEILKYPVINWRIDKNPFLVAQGNLWKRRRKDCKSWWGWKTPKKQCLLDTTGLAHMWTLRDCGCLCRACTSSCLGPELRRRSRHDLPFLIQKLPQTDH